MNLTEIKTRVWERLGEDASNPLRYTSEMIVEFINDGLELFSTLSRSRVTTSTITSIKSQRFYPLPADVIRVLSIRDDTTSIPLVASHWMEFDEGAGRIAAATGTTAVQRSWQTQESDRATHFFAFSWDEIGLWPVAATAGRTYTMTYIQAPGATLESFNQEFGVVAAMTGQQFTSEFGTMAQLTGYSFTSEFGIVGQVADDDNAPITDIPQDYHVGIVDYCIGRCLMINAKGDRLKRAQAMVDNFTKKIQDAQGQRGNAAHDWARTDGVVV